MGIVILLEVRPRVGLMPTILLRSPGSTMLPLVSVATDPIARPTDTATAFPLELPLGSCSE